MGDPKELLNELKNSDSEAAELRDKLKTSIIEALRRSLNSAIPFRVLHIQQTLIRMLS